MGREYYRQALSITGTKVGGGIMPLMES